MIQNLDTRLLALEESLANAAAGDFRPLQLEQDDALAAIELGVNIVIGDLRDEITRARASEQALREQLEQITSQARMIERQRETIAELSTPILQLWDGVIALPIIGTFDEARAIDLAERMLAAIHTYAVRFAILDVTGIESVDTSTADKLNRIVRAVRLLGAECLVTGIQPLVAQSLVTLGVDLATSQIHRNLKQALVACLRIMAEKRGT